jgi:hypothetical protein
MGVGGHGARGARRIAGGFWKAFPFDGCLVERLSLESTVESWGSGMSLAAGGDFHSVLDERGD